MIKMGESNLEKKIEEEKIYLDRRMQETIRIVKCIHPGEIEQLRKYKKILNNYAKKWKDKYGAYYGSGEW